MDYMSKTNETEPVDSLNIHTNKEITYQRPSDIPKNNVKRQRISKKSRELLLEYFLVTMKKQPVRVQNLSENIKLMILKEMWVSYIYSIWSQSKDECLNKAVCIIRNYILNSQNRRVYRISGYIHYNNRTNDKIPPILKKSLVYIRYSSISCYATVLAVYEYFEILNHQRKYPIKSSSIRSGVHSALRRNHMNTQRYQNHILKLVTETYYHMITSGSELFEKLFKCKQYHSNSIN